jgi:molybdate transport system substrate-binding protein
MNSSVADNVWAASSARPALENLVSRRLTVSFASVAAALLLAACGSSSAPAASTGTTSALSGEINVFAAASLTDAFQTLGKQFQDKNPGTTVTFNFGPSSGLSTQITQGAPADVFASASSKNMDAVVAAKLAGTASTFVKNVMEIAVPPKNPAGITQLSDLGRPGVKVALCQADVPCGTVAAKVFANAKVTVKPVTEEADVKATLTKVTLGEVDAGVVYVTDVLAAGDKVKGIEIPADVNASTSYPIATLTGSKNAALAQAFVDYVLSADGAAELSQAGFQKP